MNYRETPIVQVGRLRREMCETCGRIRQALRPLDLVPVDFKIRAQPQLMRNPWMEEAGEIDETGFVAARGHSEIGSRDFPTAATVGNLKAQRHRMNAVSL